MYSVFLSSYRNTCERLGELEKSVETLTCGLCSHSIFRSPKLPLVFLFIDRNVVHVFYFLNAGEKWVKNVVMISIILDKIAQPCYFGAKIGECCSTVCIMYFVGV